MKGHHIVKQTTVVETALTAEQLALLNQVKGMVSDLADTWLPRLNEAGLVGRFEVTFSVRLTPDQQGGAIGSQGEKASSEADRQRARGYTGHGLRDD